MLLVDFVKNGYISLQRLVMRRNTPSCFFFFLGTTTVVSQGLPGLTFNDLLISYSQDFLFLRENNDNNDEMNNHWLNAYKSSINALITVESAITNIRIGKKVHWILWIELFSVTILQLFVQSLCFLESTHWLAFLICLIFRMKLFFNFFFIKNYGRVVHIICFSSLSSHV